MVIDATNVYSQLNGFAKLIAKHKEQLKQLNFEIWDLLSLGSHFETLDLFAINSAFHWCTTYKWSWMQYKYQEQSNKSIQIDFE